MKKLLPLLFFLSLMQSCSIVERKTEVIYAVDDKRVPERLINSVLMGKTRKEWVVENIGRPDKIEHRANHNEVYIYEYTKNVDRYTSVLLLYRSESTEQIITSIFFEFNNGVLKKYWSEEISIPGLSS